MASIGIGGVSGVSTGIPGLGSGSNSAASMLPAPGKNVERHTLKAECELRIEVPFGKTIDCKITLQQGSCELWGYELAIGKVYALGDGLKLALFTWHGCAIDVECDNIDIIYESEETNANVAFVNTHAQLEAIRDEAFAAAVGNAAKAAMGQQSSTDQGPSGDAENEGDSSNEGPRVLVVGPTESGKSVLSKILVAYGAKLGRTPLFVDLDPADNSIGVPGTLAVAPMTSDTLSIQNQATGGMPPPSSIAAAQSAANAASSGGDSSNGGQGMPSNVGDGLGVDGASGNGQGGSGGGAGSATVLSPLVLFHGSTTLQPDLFKSQVEAIASKIDRRYKQLEQQYSSQKQQQNQQQQQQQQQSQGSSSTSAANANADMFLLARTSGLIVNTNGWIQDEGYQLILHTVEVLRISIILIMGHDRLYSMMTSHFNKLMKQHQAAEQDDMSSKPSFTPPKIIKLPRSGGTVSREKDFLRQARSRSMRRYFYGDFITANPQSSASAGGVAAAASTPNAPVTSSMVGTFATTNRVPQLTPFLLEISFSDVTCYKLSSISLSASLLPVDAIQSTEALQVTNVNITEKLQHTLLAVCHPNAVKLYTDSGKARDLYETGIAGFVAVERVDTDTDTLHLLSPCAGSLPSNVLLVGDITWME